MYLQLAIRVKGLIGLDFQCAQFARRQLPFIPVRRSERWVVRIRPVRAVRIAFAIVVATEVLAPASLGG